MKKVVIDLGNRSYDIVIGRGLLGQADSMVPWIAGEQVFVVTNTTVGKLYLQPLLDSLADKQTGHIELPDGEQFKTLETVNLIFDQLMIKPFDRKVTLVALGGGVVGDITGFAAACYQRGVSFIQVPTTLLAQVDSSVGGKTGVNHPMGKNMIGAFHQPRRVVIDTDLLATLPAREFSAGVSEVIKYGMISDAEFFLWLEQNMDAIMAQDADALAYIIERSCQAKAAIVEQDELEAGKRALLNFGHTFGHAIETGSGYGQWLHGEAVATGMLMAMRMSVLMGDVDESAYHRLEAMLQRANLPTAPFSHISRQQMLDMMQRDKKVANNRIQLILLRRIGDAYISADYPNALLDETLRLFCSEDE